MDIPEPSPVHPLRRALRKALRSARERAARKAEKLRAELDAAAQAGEWLEMGEILKAHLDQVPRRAESVSLPDLYHPGRERTIPLDPRLRPMENAKRLFAKHRKLADSADAKQRELDLCERELAGLEDVAARFARWEDENDPALPPPAELAEEAERLRVHVPGLRAEPAPRPSSRKDTRPSRDDVARRFTSADGLEILVGKSAADNDRLSLKLANGNDWWLHIAHQTGSHVVVAGHSRSARKGERTETFLPQETLLDAAHLAAYFSKARNATRVEVDYTQAKHVRKSRGAPAGQVTLSQHRTLSVRIEEARLARLLAGRRELSE